MVMVSNKKNDKTKLMNSNEASVISFLDGCIENVNTTPLFLLLEKM